MCSTGCHDDQLIEYLACPPAVFGVGGPARREADE